MSEGNRAALREGMRERAYGQDYRPTIIDRFGVWLSARQIRRYAGAMTGKRLGDFGCGYHAAFARTVLPELVLKDRRRLSGIFPALPSAFLCR